MTSASLALLDLPPARRIRFPRPAPLDRRSAGGICITDYSNTHDDLKWGRDSPLKKVGTFDELEPEARRIVWATLLAHPFEILQRAMVDAGRQLLRFQAGDGLSQDFARMVAGALAPVFGPGIEKSLIESKQGQGQLPVAEARQLHIAGLIFAVGICFWSIKARRQELPRKLVALIGAVRVRREGREWVWRLT